ncbi:MAG: DUF3466 family protein [Immundisolibacter sp.]|uniref:DUF3466 family protein n=1 Tax=Immundisolibacter sp. TaxID=1934948 RepID=UPI003EE0E73F
MATALAHQPQALGIDQFTILDAPSDPPVNTVTDFSAEWFNQMLREHQVTYVDNFYGDRDTAVGTTILNAAPGGGLEVAFNHTTIHTDFYSPRIGGGDWVSPIFGLNATSFSARPGPQFWDPLVLSGLTVAGDLNDFDDWPATSGFTEISALSDLGIGGTDVTNDVMVLNPNSPVSISHHFDIPIDATLLSFDFGFLDPGTGEFLQLFFDDILLWEMPWMNDLVGELLNAVVPIGSLAGLSGDLTFLLDSTNGNAQARAFLSNFEVMGSFARTAAVPEPGTLLLLGTGLLGLTGMRHAASLQRRRTPTRLACDETPDHRARDVLEPSRAKARKTLPPAFAVAMLLATSAAHAAPMYTITDLGQWQPMAINDVGQIAGTSFDPVTSQSRAVLWSGGSLSQLGPSDVINSSAADINNFGHVVGTAQILSESQGIATLAVKYIGASMVDLGGFTDGQPSDARGINNAGQVVGSSQGYINYGGNVVLSPATAFLHSQGEMVDIGTATADLSVPSWIGVDSFLTGNLAMKINNNGQVIGNTHLLGGTGFMNSFIYDPNSSDPYTMISPLLSSSSSERLQSTQERIHSLDINDHGQVVGWTYNDGFLGNRAFLYEDGAMTDLPGAALHALAINNIGQVVGYGDGIGQSGRISGLFLYENGDMKFWDELIPEDSGWSLNQGVADINNNGQIVGVGYYGNEQRAFLLTPADAPPPPVADIQYININSNGMIMGESFNPAYPTVVVTHGWQPEADDPLSQSFPLSDVSQAVAARALEDGQSLNLITYQWAAAYTADTGGSDIFSGGTFIRYNASAYGTKSAGNLLGNRLENLFEDSGYTGPVQMIGHSLGTAVNAWAMDYSSSLNVDQFTILDAPSDIPAAGCAADEQHCILPMQFTSDWFNSKLPEGQITYVDNFYGTGQGFAPAMGAPILGAAGGHFGASGGEELTGADHTEVHEIYSQRVEDDLFWTSPIFGLDNIHFSGRPGPGTWQPNPADLIAIGGELSDYPTWTATQGSVEITTLGLDVGGTTSETIAMVLQPHSPVSISHPFDIPDNATLLSFDFGFLDPGTGEFLQLYFDDILLWETPWMNDLVGELLNAVVPIGALAGLSGELTFLLDSTTGDASARAFIANFEVIGSLAVTADAVPEPGTMFLLGAGLLGLISMRRKWAA